MGRESSISDFARTRREVDYTVQPLIPSHGEAFLRDKLRPRRCRADGQQAFSSHLFFRSLGERCMRFLLQCSQAARKRITAIV
jgi:hypothetical protein